MPFWAFILSRFTLNFPQILTSQQKQTFLYFFLLYFFMMPIPSKEYIDAIQKDQILPKMTKQELFDFSIDAEITFYFKNGYYAQ
mgnify:CR=1 FL=1